MIIIGIDIGYYNLGFVKVRVEESVPTVLKAKKIDITQYTHDRIPRCDCKLRHSREMADVVLHFIQEYRDHLDEADMILVERQPPGGFGAIETLIVASFREKVEIISPNAMHKHFGIGHLDYEHRKKKTEEIAGQYLEHVDTYRQLLRKHDVADAMCMILYKMPRAPRVKNIVSSFDIFRYVSNESIIPTKT